MAVEASDKPDTPLTRVFDQLADGIDTADGRIFADSIQRGRFQEERNMTLYFQIGDRKCRLMQATIFFGRSAIFKPWAELYNIENRLLIDNKTFIFPDSDLEYGVIELLLPVIAPGGKIFVEYENDPETRKALEIGVPAAASRMGYILFQNGATWFKDWYFSEGYMEGGRKLQGEKAIKPQVKNRHMENIVHQLQNFLQTRPESQRESEAINRAIKRAKTVLDSLGGT
ncbi:MAG: DUF1122 family protein [Thermodesulfobacteriota bacterium]